MTKKEHFETLLDKALQNYIIANDIYNRNYSDEAFLNYVGYHLQQSLEMAIKFVFEMSGEPFNKTHEIGSLIQEAKVKNINLNLSDYISEHDDMFTNWESKTRYIKNYRLEKSRIEKALNEIRKYLIDLSKEYPQEHGNYDILDITSDFEINKD